MRRSVLLLIALIVPLAACSSPVQYDSTDDLREAFVDAAGGCAKAEPAPPELIGEGIDAVICMDTVTVLALFESAEIQKGYIEDVTESGLDAVTGDGWAVVGESVSDYAAPLGGSAQ